VPASPVVTRSPLLGAELTLLPGARLELSVDPAHEHGVLVDSGTVRVQGRQVERAELAFVPAGSASLEVVAVGEDAARVVLLGGEPFGEQIVMWWNFIGRSHEDVVAARAQWQAELAGAEAERFGRFDYPGDSLPAPELPGVRLRPRG
jgi:quercetin 2,3-dioxygenase